MSKHLEMEEERLKSIAPSNVAFVARGIRLKGNGPYNCKELEKNPRPSQSSRPIGSVANKKKATGNGEKNTTCMKCYN